jgi:hypothetical protein
MYIESSKKVGKEAKSYRLKNWYSLLDPKTVYLEI